MTETQTGKSLRVDIWRGGENGWLDRFNVPRQPSQTILDIVTYVQRKLDATLSYRFSCRVGMCGSCAMTVNGKPRWTCRTHVDSVEEDGRIEIRPLRNFPIVKDLAVDMTVFFDKWRDAGARFAPRDGASLEFANVDPQSPARREATAAIECIGCGVCYAACDVVAWKPDYLGPAALNRVWTLVNDERDADPEAHLAPVAGDAGCHACHSQQGCSTHCPKNLSPTAAIAGLKRRTLAALLKGRL